MSAIGRYLGIERHTASKYVHSTHFPDRRGGSKLDPFKPYMLSRWNEGCRTGMIIFEETKEMGYEGKRSVVLGYFTQLRKAQGLPPRSRSYTAKKSVKARAVRKISSRELSMLVIARNPGRKGKKRIATIRGKHPGLNECIELAESFTEMMRTRQPDGFDDWLERAKKSTRAPIRNFAKNLNRDYDAVRAAFELPWSTSPVEGHINKLKLLKRQMYGKAKLDLLEKRILYRPP